MKKYITIKNLYRLIGLLIFILIWFLISSSMVDSAFIFPSPIQTIKEVIKILSTSYVYECILITLLRLMIGYLIAFVLAFIIGVIAGNYEPLQEILKPAITILRAIPTVCLVYLFLVIAGARYTPVYIVILVSFPILYENIMNGIKSTSSSVLKAGKLDGANFLRMNLFLRIPLAKPHIIVGITSSFALSIKIEIMAEVITGYTRLGLGSAILAAQRNDPTNMVPVFAYGLIAVVIVLIIEEILNIIKHNYM